MEADILSKMHQINQMEIQVGQLAQKKGSTFAIREFGDRLARDHKKGDAMVQAFAREHKITLAAPAMSATPQEQMQKLEGLTGLAFDGYFLELMESGHKTAISMLGQAHQELQGMPLGVLVGQLLPILEQHYIIATTLDIRMRATGEAPQMSPAGGE
jgi:putative membrane protein